MRPRREVATRECANCGGKAFWIDNPAFWKCRDCHVVYSDWQVPRHLPGLSGVAERDGLRGTPNRYWLNSGYRADYLSGYEYGFRQRKEREIRARLRKQYGFHYYLDARASYVADVFFLMHWPRDPHVSRLAYG